MMMSLRIQIGLQNTPALVWLAMGYVQNMLGVETVRLCAPHCKFRLLR